MCQGLARCFLIVCNIVFLVFGIACLTVGIWVRVDKNNMMALFRISDNSDVANYNLPSLLENGAYILIGAGAVIFVISIFGFCGAIKKNKCCLITYGVLVGIILIVQISAAITAVVFQGQFDRHAKTFLSETMPKKYRGPYDVSDPVSFALDAMQATQSCCGINSTDDFSAYTHFNKTWKDNTTAKIPFTCCISNKMESYPKDINGYIDGMKNSNCPVDGKESHTGSCYDKLKELVEQYYKVVLGVAVAVALVELILIIIACCIAKKSEEEIV